LQSTQFINWQFVISFVNYSKSRAYLQQCLFPKK
jgi:hypothetical protein